MDRTSHPRVPRVVRTGLASAAAALLLLAGCQPYERADLDLSAHHAAVAARLDGIEPLRSFSERLAASDVPDRFDITDGLSPSEGEVLALFFNPELRLARLNAGVALATFETAGLWQDPEFGFDGAEIISPSAPFQYGLTLSLTVPISGRLEVEKARAGAAYEAELRRIVDAEWSTRGRVRQAWSEWSAAMERVRLVRDAVIQLERVGTIVARLEEAGELTRVESRLLRIELVTRRSELIRDEFDVARTRLALLRLIGIAPDASIELVHELPAPPTSLAGAESAASPPLDRLIDSNTLLAVRRAEYRVAEESLRLEIRKQIPDIRIGSGYGSEDRDDRLLLGLSVPIPILNANRAAIAEARARREVARAAAETTFEALSHDLALALVSLDTIRAERTAFEAAMVTLLEEQSTDVERLAELGEVNTLVLLETTTRSHDAKSRLLDLRIAEFAALTTLTQLLGPDMSREPAPVDGGTR